MGALCAFGNAVVRGPRSADTLLLALALGAALLTKGPVGLAVPALVVVTAYLILLRYAPLPPRYLAHLGIAAAAGCALFLLWALPANAATGGEFAQRGIGRHVVQRILQPLESHGGKSWLYFFYYLPATLLTFFPWTLYLPLGLAALQGEARRAPRARIVLWAWIVPIAIMMSLVATKLPHYILPVWPALAYAVALGVRRADQRILSDRERRWLKAGPWLFMPVGMLTGLALVIPVWISPLPGLRGPAFTVGLVVLAMTGAAFYMFRRRRHGAAAMVLVSGMLLIQLAIPMSVLPAVETFKISPRVAKVVAERIGPDVPVATYRYGEPSLNFYLKRRVIETLASDNAVVEWTMRNAPGVLIIPVEDVLRIVAYAGPIDAKAVATVRGYNYSKGHWVDLMVARRDR
jgi:4-amino-4-deoxy-L-arabinose transferase-like glycosyltransferase